MATAIDMVKAFPPGKFDQTVEVSLRLGVDPRKADQMVRGTVNLPAGTGKTARVVVFATGDKAGRRAPPVPMRSAATTCWSASRVAGSTSTPSSPPRTRWAGRAAGPGARSARVDAQPKTGTVTMDPGKAVSEIKGGKIEFRVDKHGNLNFIIGKASFSASDLLANYRAAMDEVNRLKPSASKGRYIKKATLSTTMGPGIPLEAGRVAADA